MAEFVAAAAQLAGPTVEAGGKKVFSWLNHKYDYLTNIKANFEMLVREKRCIIYKESDAETELSSNRSKMVATEGYQKWREDVATLIVDIEELEYKYENRPSTCLRGLCPCPALHKLGEDIIKKTREATILKDKLSSITIMRKKPASMPHMWNIDVRIVEHPSLVNHVTKLIQWLNDERKKRISIWGPPGVGKTTIMRAVLGKIPGSCSFEYVFSLNVASDDIQEAILKRLGMRMDESSRPGENAVRISDKLKDKKYLLLLDEVSSEINLEEVGICSGHTQGKVVFASRDKYVGDTDEDINVRRLSKEDAQMLFWEAVGSDPKKMGEKKAFKKVGESIIELCGGMPVMLTLIGKDLAKKSELSLWRDMKSQLQSPSSQLWQEWEEYYRSFELVYDNLPDDDHKPCLLHWAIFPFDEEINRDYVIDCWSAQEVLERPRLWETRDRGHSILRKLADKSLLDNGENLGHFKMFIGFHKAALRIANSKKRLRFFVESGKKIETKEWIQAKKVSLDRICLSPLPKKPPCRGMLTLLLHENDLIQFPGHFFQLMSNLQVLSLQNVKVGRLPSSISALKNLKGFFLENCSELKLLPSQIGDLQNLQILVVHDTGIYSLPIDIGRLTNLKCLRVSLKKVGNQEKMIPCGLFQNLSELEELNIDVCPKIKGWNVNADEIAKEITLLEKLTHLHFQFPRMKSFEYFFQNSRSWESNQEFEGFRSFNICVGQQENSLTSEFCVFDCSEEKHLKFSEGTIFNGAIFEVLKQAKSFELISHRAARNLTDEIPADALEELETCIVDGCDGMRSIVNGDSTELVFKCLRKLHLRNLRSLVTIWRGTMSSKNFQSLTSLTLYNCKRIDKLFSQEMVKQLGELQDLHVEDCETMEKIINVESPLHSMCFPKLENFQLYHLPRLSSICDASLNLPSLDTILIQTCEELRSLPRILERAPRLRNIQCNHNCWDQQDWPENFPKEQFEALRRNIYA